MIFFWNGLCLPILLRQITMFLKVHVTFVYFLDARPFLLKDFTQNQYRYSRYRFKSTPLVYDDLENELPTKAFQVNKYLQKITVFAKKLTHCNCARLKIPSIFVSLWSNIIKKPSQIGPFRDLNPEMSVVSDLSQLCT